MYRWLNPIPLTLVPTAQSESFRDMKPGETGLPLPPHPGAFGVQRRFHVHEGVDLYCAAGTPVTAVEAGVVVAIIPFTGPKAGFPHWLDTDAVLVEGVSGVVAYGEIVPAGGLAVGLSIAAGQLVGHVTRVLAKDKGRPMSMLHLELHAPGTRDCPEWTIEKGRPVTLLDPTPFLLDVAPEQPG